MKQIILILTIFFVASCGGAQKSPPSEDDDRQQNILAQETTSVEVACAKMQPFYHEIVSNRRILECGRHDCKNQRPQRQASI